MTGRVALAAKGAMALATLGLAALVLVLALASGHAAAAGSPPAVRPAGSSRQVRLARAPRDVRPAGSPRDVRLAGALPPVLARATPLAARPASTSPLTVTVVLRRRDQAGFARFLASVTDPRSPRFRHFLTQAQLTRRFGPSASSYDAVLRFVRQRGLRLVAGSANRLTVTARGSLAAVQRAFAVQIGEYRLDRHDFTANEQAPALPATLAHAVTAVVGLSSLDHPLQPAPEVQGEEAQPLCGPQDQGFAAAEGTLACACVLSERLQSDNPYNNPFTNLATAAEIDTAPLEVASSFYKTVINYRCAADELNLVTAYAVDPGPLPAAAPAARPSARLAGASAAGQRIGLLEYANFRLGDVRDFLTLDDLDPSEINDLSEQDVAGGAGPAQGAGEGEALVDIDAALSLAPGAQVVVYDTAFNGGASFQTMFNAMIQDNDTVISNSWSECEDQVSSADAQSIDEVLANAAAAGITVLNGSGDSGSTCLDGSPNTIGVPADSPHATAVGGSTATPGPLGTYGSERWWGAAGATPPTGQGGFGVSRFFARPSYQDGNTTSSGRSIPDLVANADPAEGYEICEADAGGCPDGLQYGGTSAATPIVAAFVADINAQLGHNVGELNPLIYPLATSGAFHSAASMDSDFAHVGLGSPNLDALYLQLAGSSPGPLDTTKSSLISEPRGSFSADLSGGDTLVALLLDSQGNAIAGQHVTLSAGAGSHAVIGPADGVSSADNGAVVFHVSDATPEAVTLTATDTDTGVALAPLTVTFTPPPASAGMIGASPQTVTADGQSTAQVQVRLVNALGQPAAGKTVTLVPATGTHATITGPTPLQTGANGVVTFEVTDTTAETVSFTAVDQTDGDLPVPGSATVTFSDVPQGQAQCAAGTPVAAPGYGIAPFATGFPYGFAEIALVATGPCVGPFGIAFSPSGRMYVSEYVTNASQSELDGLLYSFGADGGLADAATELPTSAASLGPISQLAFGPGGVLYGVLTETDDNYAAGEVVELDPATGAITKTIATGLECPDWIAVDPLSGDVFVSNGCSGYPHSDSILRIHDPLGASPVTSAYVTDAGSGQIAFAPDGTLFQASYLSKASNTGLLQISPTSSASPTVTPIAPPPSLDGIAGVAIGATGAGGQAQTIYALGQSGSSEEVYSYSLSGGSWGPASVVASIPDGGGGVTATAGPDGCLYVTAYAAIERVTGIDGACSLTPDPAAPQLTLTPAGVTPGPTQGTSQTLTATVRGESDLAGVPVAFVVAGANPQVRIADTDSSGAASITYQGVDPGTDDVTAQATVGSDSLTSNQTTIQWAPGPHASELDLNLAPSGGRVDTSTQLTAVLDDYTAVPATPIPGATVVLSLGGQSCQATTGASGSATCSLSTGATVGVQTLTATFAGTGQYAPSSASSQFVVSPPSPPPTTVTTTTSTQTTPTSTTTTTTVATALATSTTTSTQTATVATTVTDTSTSQAPRPAPATVILACVNAPLTLTDIAVKGSRVLLTGAARPSDAGDAVTLYFDGSTKVARSRVGAGGLFSASAPLPAARLRNGDAARYSAVIGGQRSAALKLTRRLVLDPPTSSAGRVHLTGRVIPPLGDPIAAITVQQQTSCSSARTVAHVVPARDGDYSVTLPDPKGTTAVYRLMTKVRDDTASKRLFATYSLPELVQLPAK